MMDATSIRFRRMPVIWVLLAVALVLLSVGYYLLRNGLLRIELEDGRLTLLRRVDKANTYCIRVFDSDCFREEYGLTLGGKSIERPDFIDLVLRVPFTISGKSRLVIAQPNGSGMPVEAFRKMIVLPPAGSRAIRLFVMNDLRRRVKIRTQKEALAFCRLLTSPVTYYCLDCPGVEVASKDQIDINFFFGDKDELAVYCGKKCDGCMGVVESVSDLSSLGVRPASVRKTSSSFEVRRTLLVEESPWSFRYQFVDIIETIGRDGRYSRRTINKRCVPVNGKYSFYIDHPI